VAKGQAACRRPSTADESVAAQPSASSTLDSVRAACSKGARASRSPRRGTAPRGDHTQTDERQDDRQPGNHGQASPQKQQARPVFIHRMIRHNCYGVVQAETGAFVGAEFAATGWNAIRLRPGKVHESLVATLWLSSPLLLKWDYLIVRGEHVK